MITRQLDNGVAVEITTNAGFLHDGIQYEAYLSYNDGNRLATIEYNLKTRQIIQCRAACNQHPERYDEICALVKDGMREKKYKYAA